MTETSPSPVPDPSALRPRTLLLLYGFFLTLSCWSFFPLFSHISDSFIGGEHSDVLRNSWGFWWFKAMLLERFRLPSFTVYLNYPQGMTLLVIDPLHCLLSIPLQLVFGLPAAYNLLMVMVVAFNGFGASLLARELTGRLAPGLAAGLLYGFAPYVLSNALAGTSEVVNVGWMPIFLLCLHRAILTPSKRNGLLTGGALICTALTSWYYGYLITLFGSIYALTLFPKRLLPKDIWKENVLLSVKSLAWGAGLFLLFALIMMGLYHDVAGAVQAGIAQGGRGQLETLAGNAVNLWEIYAPGRDRWDRPSLYHLPVHVLTGALLLSVLGLWRGSRFWLIGALGLLLSLSFKVQTAKVTFDMMWVLEYLPPLTRLSQQTYEAFLQLPFASAIRFPARFLALFLLGLSMASACGLGLLLSGVEWGLSRALSRLHAQGQTVQLGPEPPRTRGAALMDLLPVGIPLILSGLLAIGINTEMLRVSRFHEIFAVTPLPRPAWINVLNSDPAPGAVLHLPTDLQGRFQLYTQTLHHRPLLGYVDFVTSRRYYLSSMMLPLSFSHAYYGLQQRGYDDFIKSYPPNVPEWPSRQTHLEQVNALKAAGLRYVLVERSRFQPQSLVEFEALVADTLDRVVQLDGVDVYRTR